jgi:hypothetical protein
MEKSRLWQGVDPTLMPKIATMTKGTLEMHCLLGVIADLKHEEEYEDADSPQTCLVLQPSGKEE